MTRDFFSFRISFYAFAMHPTTLSLYAPVTGQEFGAVPGAITSNSSKENTFMRCFTILKAQRTVLSRTQFTIENRTPEDGVTSPQGEAACRILLEVLDSILNANLCKMFIHIDEGLVKLRETLNQSDLDAAVRKWGILVVGSLISIKKMAETLVFCVIFLKSPEGEKGEARGMTEERAGCETTVVCRICDESIPIDRFEEHVESCIAVYRSESKLSSVDAELRDVVHEFGQANLDHEWPGVRAVAVHETIPLLQIWLMFAISLGIDARTNDGSEELKKIATVLQQNIMFGKYGMDEMVRRGTKLVIEKSRRSTVLTNAANILRETRLSGSGTMRRESTRIRDFIFIKRISRGAFARVFLARKKKTGDLFAIKVQSKSDVTQKNQLKRVFTERDILLQHNNPNIVNFYYSMIGKNNLYVVMEYLPGGDLYSLLNQMGALDESSAKIYTYEIVQALAFLRSNGIIHHDLKPDNILISAEGTLKLTDFGLSHLGFVDRHTTSEIAKSSSLVGTPDYIAPEVILSQPHSFSADYWSLGAMLYEFLAGVPPFHAETEKETYANILTGHVDFGELEDVSEEAIDLIKRLLVMNPEDRIGAKSIDEIVHHPWFNGLGPNTPPPFVPSVGSDEDTNYFESRYEMNDDDSDVLEDMDEDDSETSRESDGDIQGFRATSVEQLARQNLAVAQRLRRVSPSPPPPTDFSVDALLVDNPPPNHRQQLTMTQMLPRPTLSHTRD